MRCREKRVLGIITLWYMTFSFAQNVSSNYSLAVEDAFLPDTTGIIKTEKIRALLESFDGVPKGTRRALELDVCQRFLDFPLATNAHTTTWALVQKSYLFYDLSKLSYWQTNRVAMLQLADHLGRHSTISTNFFQAEFDKATELDQNELKRERLRCKRKGNDPNWSMRLTNYRKSVKTRFLVINIWNKDIIRYRQWLFGAFSKLIFDCAHSMPDYERRCFMDQFISRGKLSSEEVRQVFGPDAERIPMPPTQ